MCLSGANSDTDEESSDTMHHQQPKLSAQQTLGKIDEVIENTDTIANESIRDLLFKVKNELEKIVISEKSKNLKQSKIVSFLQKM